MSALDRYTTGHIAMMWSIRRSSFPHDSPQDRTWIGPGIALGFGPSKSELLLIRARWAQITNETFRQAGLDLRIDHRSLKARGIDREPALRREKQHDPRSAPALTAADSARNWLAYRERQKQAELTQSAGRRRVHERDFEKSMGNHEKDRTRDYDYGL
jgi:hypothetical protein